MLACTIGTYHLQIRSGSWTNYMVIPQPLCPLHSTHPIGHSKTCQAWEFGQYKILPQAVHILTVISQPPCRYRLSLRTGRTNASLLQKHILVACIVSAVEGCNQLLSRTHSPILIISLYLSIKFTVKNKKH